MNRMLKPTLLAVASMGVLAQTARAQYNPNDLILGFTQSGAANDYIIDLGNANSTVGANGTTLVNLSGDFSLSTFNSTFSGGLAAGVNMGIVGGSQPTVGRDLYMTVLRNGPGTPSLAGSTAPANLGSTAMSSGVGDVAAMLNGLALSPGGSTTISQGNANSWTTWVLGGPDGTGTPSFVADTGKNPMGEGSSSIIYEDLYRGTPGTSGSMTYLGFFTLDTSGGGSLTFTPSVVAVPEPSAYGLIAGGGLLLLALRKQIRSKHA